MNERIRKLMEGLFDVTVDSRGREECTADYANVQRFAELIALECARVVNESSPTGMIGVNAIRIHFGVK